MGSNLPIVLIELVLVFGGVLGFAWWQLRSLERDRANTRAERERAQRDATAKETNDAP